MRETDAIRSYRQSGHLTGLLGQRLCETRSIVEKIGLPGGIVHQAEEVDLVNFLVDHDYKVFPYPQAATGEAMPLMVRPHVDH